MTRFRSALLASLINLGVALPLFTGCSAAQKREEKAALVCAGDELAQVIAVLESGDGALAELGALTPDVIACAKQAQAAGSGSGSAQ